MPSTCCWIGLVESFGSLPSSLTLDTVGKAIQHHAVCSRGLQTRTKKQADGEIREQARHDQEGAGCWCRPCVRVRAGKCGRIFRTRTLLTEALQAAQRAVRTLMQDHGKGELQAFMLSTLHDDKHVTVAVSEELRGILQPLMQDWAGVHMPQVYEDHLQFGRGRLGTLARCPRAL